jgi:hypothetical protein
VARSAGWGQGSENGINDAVHAPIDLVIPEAQDMESRTGEMSISNSVGSFAPLKSVLCAINLNDEALGEFGEVDDISIDRNLPAKVMTLSIQMFQLHPKLHFLRRHCLA